MPHFTFKAKKVGGDIHKGESDAKDRFELYKILKASGEEVISVEEEKKGRSFSKSHSFTIFNYIKTQEKINFSRSLGSMLKAGLSLSQALTVIEKQGKNTAVTKVVKALNDEVRQGKTLAQSMSSFPKMFSPLMVAMVASGEKSGSLSEALRIVTLQMEKSYALERRVRSAFIYPSVIFFVMIVIAIILLTYVVPNLTKTFNELNVTLPAITRAVVFASTIVQHDFLLFLGVIILIAIFFRFWSQREEGKKIVHWFVLKIPIIGNLVQEVNVARTARTLSSLISAGIDVLESLKITEEIVQNVHYKKILAEAYSAVEKGDQLSKTFSEHENLYPVFLSQMLSVGEETGKIDEMMLGVAVYYEDDVDVKTKDMSTVIEPFLMVVIGIAVGFFAVAMISPMYSLVNTI